MRLYLDTAVLIYLIEEHRIFEPMVRRRLAEPGTEVVTGELTRLECKVQPLRNGNHALLQDYEDYLARVDVEVLPVTRPALDRAARLRADHAWLKTPDAIHLGAAIEAGCEGFFTSDRRLERCGGEIAVEILAR